MKEAWRPIDLNHDVSSMGRIRGHKGILKPWVHTTGYLMIRLSFKGKGQRVHRLVAHSFIPNPENKKTINHKNGEKLDNRASNIEWATQRENNIHARYNGLNANTGENHNMAKLTYKQVGEIRKLYRPGKSRYHEATMSQAKLARRYGVTQSTICDIIRNKSWRGS